MNYVYVSMCAELLKFYGHLLVVELFLYKRPKGVSCPEKYM
jgi:hypothetical protein